ncbi:TPA: hypothetical protein NKO30_006407 [Pseudomonas aeruginosa]|nr:hypothetical protein [Pseudomonas aeruginosa]
MSEVHRYSVVKMLSEAGNKISYDPHGPEVVMAKDYDDLAAKLAMAEDASKERDRLKAENEALRESLQALIHISDATGWKDHTCGEIAKARAALEGAKP